MKKQHAYRLGKAFRRGLAFYLGAHHKALMAQDAARWITLHPHGGVSEEDYVRVKIESETGEILQGMGGKFNGTHIDDLPRGKNPHPIDEDKYQAWKKRQDERKAKSENTEKTSNKTNLPFTPIWERYSFDQFKKLPESEKQKESDRILNRISELRTESEKKTLNGEIAWREDYETAYLREERDWMFTGQRTLIDIDGKAILYAGKDGKLASGSVWIYDDVFGIPTRIAGQDVTAEAGIESAKILIKNKTEELKKAKERVAHIREYLKTNKYKDCETAEEAEKLAKDLLSGSRYVSYNGLSADQANQFNKALFSVLSDFPEAGAYLTIYGGRDQISKLMRDDSRQKLTKEQKAAKAIEIGKYFDLAYGEAIKTIPQSALPRYFGIKYYGPMSREELRQKYIDSKVRKLSSSASKIALDKIPGHELANSTSTNWAWANHNGAVSFNLMLDDKDFTATVARNILSGYHPISNCGGVESVMTHELGHVMMTVPDKRGFGARLDSIESIYRTQRKNIPRELSGYAAKDACEMCAEAFCEARTADKPRPFALKVYETMKNEYRKGVEKQQKMLKDYLGE